MSSLSQDICQSCLKSLPILPQGCLRCANILPLLPGNVSCGVCLKNPPPFDRTYALFCYQQPVTHLILQLKFQHALAHARLLGELLAVKIQQEYQHQPLPELLIPVPLHTQRLTERGFNQALEIARPIAKALQLTLLIQHCKRQKATEPQATLPAAERQKNLRNAFEITCDLTGKHIAVIDDVITTGFTITEFCHALKKQGAKKIDVWCCARPVREGSFPLRGKDRMGK